MEAGWRIELFGGLRVRQGDRAITRFRTWKTGALLGYLAYFPDRMHPREELIERLWPESNRDAARNNLRVALSSLRHQLEPPGIPAGSILFANRLSVGLNPAAVTTDVAAFEAAIQAVQRAGSAVEREQALTTAVSLYCGELLQGYYEGWIPPERERLEDLFFQMLRRLIEHLRQAGEIERALVHARQGVSADPTREAAHYEVMRLYAAAGQPLLALRQYRELEQILKQELGESPGRATHELARDLVRSAAGNGQAVQAGGQPVPETPAVAAGRSLPDGTVTFLLIDLEDRPALQEQAGDSFPSVLAQYHQRLRQQLRRHRGHVVKEAEGFSTAAFSHASDALECAIAIQKMLAAYHVGATGRSPFRIRMALDTGEVEVKAGKYRGSVLERAMQVLLAGHGGQILCSEETAVLLRRDLKPGIRLIDLGIYRLREAAASERLFQVEYPDMPQSEFPPLKAASGYASHLPLPFTRFFGREEEIGQLQGWLLSGETRLVTLTGPPGSGKTRLALEVAKQVVPLFHSAVWFVPLADLSDARLIPDAVLEGLHIQRAPRVEPLEQIVESLSRQPSLLVLDNFEHLVEANPIHRRDAENAEEKQSFLENAPASLSASAVKKEDGAWVVRTLLERVSTLTCLVTSRQRLELSGEQEFPVTPLPTPGANETPEALMSCASVQLFVDRAQAVKPDFQVTARNAASVADLCSRLEGIPLALELAAAKARALSPGQMLSQWEHRFDFLETRRRDASARHRTLKAALDWSYQLLSPDLQRFFARLSVFRGGWTPEAAEAVCEEPRALEYLAQLVECSVVIAEDTEQGMRHRMLEMLREYGKEQLRTEEAAALERRHAEYYVGLAEEADEWQNEPGMWQERLETEQDNLRATLEWSQLEQNDAEIGLRLAGALGWFWRVRGYWREGCRWLEEALERNSTGSTNLRAQALYYAGHLSFLQGDCTLARTRFEESLGIARELDYTRGVAISLSSLAEVDRFQGDYASARLLWGESLTILRDLGDQRGIAEALWSQGRLAFAQGDYASARLLYEESLAIWRELEDTTNTAKVLNTLGIVASAQGNYTLARSLFEESLPIHQRMGNKEGIESVLTNLGIITFEQGDHASARLFSEESLAIARELGDKDGIACVLDILGNVCRKQGDYVSARLFYTESLTIFKELGHKQYIAESLEGFARLAASQDQLKRAARLMGAEEALREAIGTPRHHNEQPKHDAYLTMLRQALSQPAFTAAWEAGYAMSWEDAVADALRETEEQ